MCVCVRVYTWDCQDSRRLAVRNGWTICTRRQSVCSQQEEEVYALTEKNWPWWRCSACRERAVDRLPSAGSSGFSQTLPGTGGDSPSPGAGAPAGCFEGTIRWTPSASGTATKTARSDRHADWTTLNLLGTFFMVAVYFWVINSGLA